MERQEERVEEERITWDMQIEIIMVNETNSLEKETVTIYPVVLEIMDIPFSYLLSLFPH